jgi:parafibromin
MSLPPKKGYVNNKSHTSGGQSSAIGNTSKGAKKTYLIGKKPVIVVPKGMTAPITLLNAYDFLANAKFIPRDVIVKQQAGMQKVIAPTTFTRQVQGVGGSTGGSSAGSSTYTGLLEYEITDNPRKLLGPDPKEWERIVAVIVLGQSWQFKDWHKLYSTPATLFDNVIGYYISMEGDKESPEVSGWSVIRSFLNRDKRGLDRVTYASFWNRLDEWMRVYKPELLPQTDLSNQ